MHISRNIYNYTIIFFLLFIFSSCQNANEKVGQHDSIASIKKETCASCKTMSRAAMLKAASGNVAEGSNPSKDEMVFIKGGSFEMGSNDFADAKPLHTVTVNSFYMDVHEVTNAQFAAFVKATGYITVAEQKLNPADYPGVPADKLVPGSGVFTPPNHAVNLDNPTQWWTYEEGASWRHPKG
ncbi:MAG: SUMF1/EgtB/PvdO family nonheme iron enzyme, partial [Parafilimonas sp.]